MGKYEIDKKIKVMLGGVKQKIHIKGEKLSNPILLFLHGGPGVSNRHSVIKFNSDLCNDFTIVAWDQRGNGGSYKGATAQSMTVDQLVFDARDLVSYLCKTLKKEKVFLLGGSWGSELGTFLSYRFPEQIGAYVGFGQVVNGSLNETISYDFTVAKATEANDQESLDILKRIGPPIGGQYKPVFEGLMAHRKILNRYGGSNMAKKSYWQSTVKPMLLSTEFSFSDKIGLIKGYKFTLTHMWPTLCNYNFVTDCNKFKVPYYIFQGKHDNNTPSALIDEFFNAITAPDKALIWFENSAHGPLAEEPVKFKKMLREKLLGVGIAAK